MDSAPLTGVVCLCSRGLVHSRTIESIENNLEQLRTREQAWRIVFTHDLPIPEAQNEIVKRARALGPEWIMFVEEDNVLPDGMIAQMMRLAILQYADVVTADYRLPRGMTCVHRSAKTGEVVFSGMGCLLVRARVFDRVPQPWFDTREFYWNDELSVFEVRAGRNGYGGQDVDFFYKLREAGIRAVEIKRQCGHLRLKNDFTPRTNNGCYEVIEL